MEEDCRNLVISYQKKLSLNVLSGFGLILLVSYSPISLQGPFSIVT